MIRLVILLGIIYFGFKILKAWFLSNFVNNENEDQDAQVMIKDPVCGVFFPKKDAFTYVINGKTHYFCSDKCKNKYLLDSQK